RVGRLKGGLPRSRRVTPAREALCLPAMATSTSEPPDPELEQAAWDLDALVEGEGEAGVERQLDEALGRAGSFAERYAGKLEQLDGAGLARAGAGLGAGH